MSKNNPSIKRKKKKKVLVFRRRCDYLELGVCVIRLFLWEIRLYLSSGFIPYLCRVSIRMVLAVLW